MYVQLGFHLTALLLGNVSLSCFWLLKDTPLLPVLKIFHIFEVKPEERLRSKEELSQAYKPFWEMV